MPARVSLELKGLREQQREAERIVRELGGGPMVEAMRQATMLVQGTAKREAKVDTGMYRASITPAVSVHGTVVEGIVGSNLKYAPYVVLDTRPHWPPIEAIRQWVHRKGIGGRVLGQGRIRRASASVERGIAFLIARKIARRGTKGDRSLMLGIERNAPRIYALFERAVVRVLREGG